MPGDVATQPRKCTGELAKRRRPLQAKPQRFRATAAVTVPLLAITITEVFSPVNTNIADESLNAKAEA
jgi:hypothetical protein